MESLYRHYVLAHSTDMDAFASAHKFLYLVKRPTIAASNAASEDDDEEDAAEDIPTQVIMKDTDSTALRDREADATEWRLARIQKRPGFPPFNRIVVGRTTVCDLVLPFHSVSRFHAQFHVESHRVVAIEDKGSRNGTFLNGRRLGAHEVAKIEYADELRFGEVSCVVLDGAGLFGLLRAM